MDLVCVADQLPVYRIKLDHSALLGSILYNVLTIEERVFSAVFGKVTYGNRSTRNASLFLLKTHPHLTMLRRFLLGENARKFMPCGECLDIFLVKCSLSKGRYTLNIWNSVKAGQNRLVYLGMCWREQKLYNVSAWTHHYNSVTTYRVDKNYLPSRYYSSKSWFLTSTVSFGVWNVKLRT